MKSTLPANLRPKTTVAAILGHLHLKPLSSNIFKDSYYIAIVENSGSPHKIVEVLNSWAFSGIGAIIRSRQPNRVDVNPIFIPGVRCR